MGRRDRHKAVSRARSEAGSRRRFCCTAGGQRNALARHQSHGAVRRGSVMGMLACLIVCGLLSAVDAVASFSRGLPVSPTYLGATAAYDGLQLRPRTIGYTGDGTGFLGGAHARGPSSGIHWTKWTRHVALGRGFNQLDNCTPDCAGGAFRGYRVKIELWRPRALGGRLVFTRLTIFYTRPPRGEPRHYTFTDSYSRGGYGWGPPDEQFYCVHTHGLRPAAGCKEHPLAPLKRVVGPPTHNVGSRTGSLRTARV